jgi:branched-chain amino acid transport system substrate-binding protein
MLLVMRTLPFVQGDPMPSKLKAILVVLLCALGTALVAEAQAPIRIGASLSLTGTYAALGQNQQRGYQLCAKHVNDKGGVLGRKIDFVLYDDQSQPATGVRLYEKLITQDKVDVVLGPYSSAITEAVANVNEKYKMPMVAPMASTTSIFKKGRKFIFMVQSPAEVYLEGLIDVAASKGLKTLALINEDTLFPKATVQGTIELAKKKGLQVVFVEAYPKGNTDFSAILTKVRAANPDVLGAATYFDDAVAITRQMKELNVNPKMYGVTVGGDLPKFYELLGRNAEFVYGATQWEPELPYPGAKEFNESYGKEFPGADLSYHSAGGYAGCQILVDAIKRAGSLDGEKIRDAILKMDLDTVYGGFKVDQDGFQVSHKMVMFQWQDGKKVIVWPDELAAGKARFPTPPWNQR